MKNLKNEVLSDEELVELAKNNDQRAFNQLMEKYKPIIFREVISKVGNRDLAEDLSIEALAKAFTQIHKYQPDYKFSTWLKRVTMNHVIDYMRKKKLATTSIDQYAETDNNLPAIQLKQHEPEPDQQLEKKERNTIVRDYVERLKEMYRSLIELRYYDELSYEEIAQLQAIPIGTVKARLHRAKGMLHQMMAPNRGLY